MSLSDEAGEPGQLFVHLLGGGSLHGLRWYSVRFKVRCVSLLPPLIAGWITGGPKVFIRSRVDSLMASPYRDPAEPSSCEPVPMPRVGDLVLLGGSRWPARVLSTNPFLAQVCGGVLNVDLNCDDYGKTWCYPHPEVEIPFIARR